MDPVLSWYQEFPCGRKATTWHNGRPMCRGCRSEALRAEAWHRRVTEGGVIGRLMNATPNILLVGLILVSIFVMGPDRLWESLQSEEMQLLGYFVFFAFVWGMVRAADHWLVRAWLRWRKAEKHVPQHDDGNDDTPVPLE